QGLVDHLADRAQRVLGRNPLLEGDVAEHRVLLLLVSTHATYITYLPVERLVPSQVPATFSAASEAVPQRVNSDLCFSPSGPVFARATGTVPCLQGLSSIPHLIAGLRPHG